MRDTIIIEMIKKKYTRFQEAASGSNRKTVTGLPADKKNPVRNRPRNPR
ncbi:MAG: hypothetical protein GWM98_25305 [Nitrospinaceae bacterium]|nr:hypothetical protein [Nitrospinaceae bacterium]NIR57186.1 hypothetical protein [Nitrospinaceae bacterium]NIS87628.1 hypothetical protein [Nitrospinaceae bacterium]NIT84496.1 hypothetical protein [Nitrospinaceae bacterium]NIU46685.1 hypothetical protein [Nitrospinaceae bacterium]